MTSRLLQLPAEFCRLMNDKRYGPAFGCASVSQTANPINARLAQSDGTTLEAAAAGIALNPAATGQPVTYAKHGSVINPGATLVLGDVYCVSVTAGGIGLIEELASTNKISMIGYPLSTSSMKVHIINTELAHGA